jgi:hypothetical protein
MPPELIKNTVRVKILLLINPNIVLKPLCALELNKISKYYFLIEKIPNIADAIGLI